MERNHFAVLPAYDVFVRACTPPLYKSLPLGSPSEYQNSAKVSEIFEFVYCPPLRRLMRRAEWMKLITTARQARLAHAK